MNNDIKRYLHEVKILLPVSNKDSKDFIKLLKQNIDDSDLTNYEDIVERIGEPNYVASSFLADMECDELISKAKKNNYRRKTAILLVIVIIICGALRCIYLTKLYYDCQNQTPVQVEEQITEE